MTQEEYCIEVAKIAASMYNARVAANLIEVNYTELYNEVSKCANPFSQPTANLEMPCGANVAAIMDAKKVPRAI